MNSLGRDRCSTLSILKRCLKGLLDSWSLQLVRQDLSAADPWTFLVPRVALASTKFESAALCSLHFMLSTVSALFCEHLDSQSFILLPCFASALSAFTAHRSCEMTL